MGTSWDKNNSHCAQYRNRTTSQNIQGTKKEARNIAKKVMRNPCKTAVSGLT